MKRLFADAVYWIAIANHKDQWHAKVVAVMRSLGQATLVTTEEVLDEFLTYYSGHGPILRNNAAQTVEDALADPLVIVRPQTHQSFLDGFGLYKARLDKEYSLTDCISCVAKLVMWRRPERLPVPSNRARVERHITYRITASEGSPSAPRPPSTASRSPGHRPRSWPTLWLSSPDRLPRTRSSSPARRAPATPGSC